LFAALLPALPFPPSTGQKTSHDFLISAISLNFASLFKNTRKKTKDKMANHQSSKKRIRQEAKRRLHNRYYKKTTRSAIGSLRELTDKSEAEQFLPKVTSMIDRLAKRGTWHDNKAANLKRKLARYVNSL